ncbi:MAG: structural maintenance of chromosomes protein 5 [Amphiamblys sp. WSBS2006]|nr:MAG: structural maintenance of chromosomes protein 5 [Amphiamblys sp. WSBS2006]
MQEELDSFEHGSIIRMKLKNFMTYKNAVIEFGPNMNMIIGPNGCGKSAVVCALTLCLAGTTAIIGRGKELGAFIKNGTECAEIEITLKSNQSKKKSVAIERKLFRGRNHHSEYKIAGTKATAADVALAAKEHNIHLNNLCQLLPQEKVADFARLSPHECLLETEKAILPDLFEKHTKLIQLDTEMKQVRKSQADDKRQMDEIQKDIERNQGQISRLKEYQASERRFHHLQTKRPFVRYAEAQEAQKNTLDKIAVLSKHLEELARPFQALKDGIADKKQTFSKIEREIKKERKAVSESEGELRTHAALLEKQEQHCELVRDKILAVSEKKASLRESIKKLEWEIRELDEYLKKPPKQPIDFYDVMHIDHTRKLAAKTEGVSAIEKEQKEIEEAGKRNSARTNELKQQLSLTDDHRKKKEDILEKIDQNTYRAYMWLKENTGLFSKKVYGPGCMVLGVKDQFYADVTESLLSRNMLLAFFCFTEKDYQTLLHHTADKHKWIVNVVLCTNPIDRKTPERMPRDELGRLGFECFADEMLVGPDEVIGAVCEANKIDLVPLSRETGSHAIVRSAEKNPSIKRFCVGNVLYDIKRNKATELAATRTIQSKKSRFMGLATNREELEIRAHEIETIKEAMKRNKTRYAEILEEKNKTLEQINQMNENFEEIERKRRELKDIHREYNKNKRLIELKRDRKLKHAEDLEHTEHNSEDRKALRQMIRERFEAAKELPSLLEHLGEATDIARKKELALLQTHMAVLGLERKVEDSERLFVKEKDELDLLGAALEKEKEAIAALRKEKDETVVDDSVRNVFELLPDTVREIDAEIERERIRKANLNDKDLSVLAEYERKRTELRAFAGNMKHGEKAVEAKKTEIEALRREWEAPLTLAVEGITERFTKLFETIGYAGCVVLAKTEDSFDWKIEIHVKFRNTEKLHQLSAARQSGGERSVSTIAYLLALHEMFRLPFRVVDEINQGMDASNERKVHNILVESSLNKPSQFILVTPKLLSDLNYTSSVRIICIYNGKYYLGSSHGGGAQQKLDSYLNPKRPKIV